MIVHKSQKNTAPMRTNACEWLREQSTPTKSECGWKWRPTGAQETTRWRAIRGLLGRRVTIKAFFSTSQNGSFPVPTRMQGTTFRPRSQSLNLEGPTDKI